MGILRFSTNINSECCTDGDRSPSIWFHPNRLKIRFSYSFKNGDYKDVDFGEFHQNVDYNIEIKAIGDYVIWYTNGTPEMTYYIPLSDRSFTSSCTYGVSFGAENNDSMWVANGCRGKFNCNGNEIDCASWNYADATCLC